MVLSFQNRYSPLLYGFHFQIKYSHPYDLVLSNQIYPSILSCPFRLAIALYMVLSFGLDIAIYMILYFQIRYSPLCGSRTSRLATALYIVLSLNISCSPIYGLVLSDYVYGIVPSISYPSISYCPFGLAAVLYSGLILSDNLQSSIWVLSSEIDYSPL